MIPPAKMGVAEPALGCCCSLVLPPPSHAPRQGVLLPLGVPLSLSLGPQRGVPLLPSLGPQQGGLPLGVPIRPCLRLGQLLQPLAGGRIQGEVPPSVETHQGLDCMGMVLLCCDY